MIPPSKDGTCPFKRDENHDCQGCFINSPVVCAWVMDDQRESRGKSCDRYYRECSLRNIQPATFCCKAMENLFHDCAEESGYYAGCFDLRKYPNDGKDVWRNYARTQFIYCPFCGTKQSR